MIPRLFGLLLTVLAASCLALLFTLDNLLHWSVFAGMLVAIVALSYGTMVVLTGRFGP
jgi:hypothetical protein